MKLKISLAAGVAALVLAAALAQDADPSLDALAAPPAEDAEAATGADAGADPAADPFLVEQQAPGADEGFSELDALSGVGAEPFPDIEQETRRKPVSVTLRALDKVTAKYKDLVVAMDAPTAFGTLEITPRFCDKRPPEEFPETTAFVQITDKSPIKPSKLKIDPRKKEKPKAKAGSAEQAKGSDKIAGEAWTMPPGMIFSGWMFASSPGLNGLEHPVYDVWVIDCKTARADS